MPHHLIIDTETSHLFDYSVPADAPGQPRLAQIGLLFVAPDESIEAEHEFLIKPEGWEMSAEATEKTGLTTEYLREHGVPIASVLPMYQAAIVARRVVNGFNVQFDLKMMRAELRRAAMEDRYMETRHLCLMWGCRAIVGATGANGKVKIPTLAEACQHFGIEQPTEHRALADAMSAYHIRQKLIGLGALPEPKNPYDKKPKAAKAPKPAKAPKLALTGNEEIPDVPETDAQQEIPL